MDFGSNIRSKVKFIDSIIYSSVPVYPYFIKVFTDGVLIFFLLPFELYGRRFIQHIAQAEHTSCASLYAQVLKNGVQLAGRSQRHVIHDQDIGLKGTNR